MIRIITAALAAFVMAACGGLSHPGASAPEYKYSHSIHMDGVCAVAYTTDERVMLACTKGGELVDICAAEPDGDTTVDVYALPRAADGAPFGVASHVEIDTSGCVQ